MRTQRIRDFCLVVGPLLALALLSAGGRAWATEFLAEETHLNPSGTAYEINPDADGSLWIGDYGSGEIRRLYPETGSYTVYQDLGNPNDARTDGAGNVWWSDFGNQLQRLALGSDLVTTWTLPAGSALLGTTVDPAGSVWVTDYADGLLHHFSPTTTELCTYAVPDGGTSFYIVADGSDIWLSDHSQSRILRLDTSSETFTMWDLPWASYVNGLATDQDGNLWLAESGDYSLLARLEPQINHLTVYPLPVGVWPEMVTLHQGRVWYSEDYDGTIGVLDPATAVGGVSTLTVSSTQVTPSCSTLGPGTSEAAATSSGTATWATSVLTTVVESRGWTVYSMPDGSAPWGIGTLDGDIFVVDQGRQTLLRIQLEPENYQVFLPMVLR